MPTWGTNRQDRAALAVWPNVCLLAPVDDIDVLLARTRVLPVPSLWPGEHRFPDAFPDNPGSRAPLT